MLPPLCFTVGVPVIHSSLSKHGEWRLYQRIFGFYLTTGHFPDPPLEHPDGLWQNLNTADFKGQEQNETLLYK